MSQNKNTIKYIFPIITAILLGLINGKLALASEITPQNVIDLVNQARMQDGKQLLVFNEQLSEAAKEKADDMLQKQYFAHTSPQGLTPWYWIEKNNYDYKMAGENLAINFNDAQQQQKAWMDSPTHRKNILNENYKETGIAVENGILNGNETIVTVQLFGVTQDGLVNPAPSAPTVLSQSIEKPVNVKIIKAGNYYSPLVLAAVLMLIIGSLMIDVMWIYKRQHEKAMILHISR